MSITQRKPQLGLTLIESLVSLAVLSILVLQALPAFSAFLDQNRRRSLTNDLVSSLRYAHTEAIRRGVSITVRKNGTQWEQGYFAFVDTNGNGSQDTGEALLNNQNVQEAYLGHKKKH